MSATDYDVIIVGSGFGGSVTALRLAEKGSSVCVLERGRRFASEDFAKTNWNLPRYLWMPRLGWRGPQVMTPLGSLLALTGSGVGGGSLVYGGVLDEPPAGFLASGRFGQLTDWRGELEPHFETARTMLGATRAPMSDRFDDAFELAAQTGSYTQPEVGLLLSDRPGENLPDPYFDGRGPDRRSCNFCGGCLTGCRYGAKNTLDKNYLYLAEQAGAEVRPDSLVTGVAPLGAEDGRDGYSVTVAQPGLFSRPETITARRVVVAAGTIGTNRLLLRCRDVLRSLPRLSAALGTCVTNNREELLFVRSRDPGSEQGVAIQSLARLGDTTILGGRFGAGASLLMLAAAPFALSVNGQPGVLGSLAKLLRHPIESLRLASPRRWVQTTRLLVAMQQGEGPEGEFVLRGGFGGMSLRGAFSAALPTAHAYAIDAGRDVDGTAQAFLTNAAFRMPATAHIFGGAPMGHSRDSGVVDVEHQVHGYEGLYVIDGSTITGNPGVAPSLLITAMAERAAAAMGR